MGPGNATLTIGVQREGRSDLVSSNSAVVYPSPLRPIRRHYGEGTEKETRRSKAGLGKCHGCNEKGEETWRLSGSKKAHDEAEKLRVEYLIAEKVSEADSDNENTFAASPCLLRK